MHIIKVGGRMCVTYLFGVYVLSLLSTKHVALPSYNIEITPHKHTIPIATKSSNANNWKWLIYHFNFLMTR
jgi:hypothetical protein